MYWLIGAFCAFFFGVSYLKKKFMSPYTLTYIFGLKGAGKSTFMLKMMLKDIDNGWQVYTNMFDVNLPGVHLFDVQQLTRCAPPPGSAIYIDEAGLVWDNRGFKEFDKGFTEYFKLQRKYKNKVVINSQALDVDKKIRDLVDRMYLMTNIFGCIGVARPLRRTIKVLEAQGNSESRLAMNLQFEGITKAKFFWMPSYWRYFDSFQAPERPLPVNTFPVDPQTGELQTKPQKRPSMAQQLRRLARNLRRK